MINARAETLEEKTLYRGALQSRKCLVPASGFYEWQAQGAKKQPYKIALRKGALMAFAETLGKVEAGDRRTRLVIHDHHDRGEQARKRST